MLARRPARCHKPRVPLDCLVLGDSIALGAAGALRAAGTPCVVEAKVGAGSGLLPRQIASAGLRRVVIVSTGSNDHDDRALEANLLGARMALGSARVVWLLPYRRFAAYAVTRVAFRFGDGLVDLAPLPSRDHVHPVDYRRLAEMLAR